MVATGGGGTIQAEASVKCFIVYEGGEMRKKTSSVLKQICWKVRTYVRCNQYILSRVHKR